MAATPTIKMSVERVVDVTVVRFEDKEIVFNELAIADLSRRLLALVENDGTRRLILNFEVVEGLCSYLLGTLFRLQKRLVEELKGRLVFCGIKKHLREVFQITTLDRLVEIVDDEQAALQKF
jgi:anti-anti-sigma factor